MNQMNAATHSSANRRAILPFHDLPQGVFEDWRDTYFGDERYKVQATHLDLAELSPVAVSLFCYVALSPQSGPIPNPLESNQDVRSPSGASPRKHRSPKTALSRFLRTLRVWRFARR